MGGGVSALHVDDDKKSPHYGIGYAKAMFTAKEWKTLKRFANKHNIHQTDLNSLTIKFLSDADAQLRNMRVAINDFKVTFATQPLILQECADLFIPQIFLKPATALNPPYSLEEISFTRFIYLGYLFALQPIQDLFYDFFAITKRNFDLQIISSIFSFNVQQISLLLTENLKTSTTLRYLHERCNVKNDTELTLEDVMRLALKYPLLFYPLVQFRKCFQRKFFGDIFWKDRKDLPSRFFEWDPRDSFESVDKAHLTSAQAIIGDYLDSTPPSLNTDPSPFHTDPIPAQAFFISPEIFRRMKSELGYRVARQLVLESGFSWSAEEQPFMAVPVPEDHQAVKDERIFDSKLRATFVMNVGSGLRAWVETYRGRDGRVLREEYFRTDRSHFERDKELDKGRLLEGFSEQLSSQSNENENEELDSQSESMSASGFSVSGSLASSNQRSSVRSKTPRKQQRAPLGSPQHAQSTAM
jgi:hypothetical protein